MKLVTFFLFFCLSLSANAASLKIIVVPSAHKLQWDSTSSLIKSFLKSQTLAQRGNIFSDAQRRAIGHVVAKIECSSQIRWTSISINPVDMTPLILKKGIRGMFAESSKGLMQSEAEIKRFLSNNHQSAMVMKFPVDQESCEEMLKMDDIHRVQNKVWFGPTIDTLVHYQRSYKLGGSGSTYALALKQLDLSNHVDLKQWTETVVLPGSDNPVTFVSAQRMWEFVSIKYVRASHLRISEKFIDKKREVRLRGIVLDSMKR